MEGGYRCAPPGLWVHRPSTARCMGIYFDHHFLSPVYGYDFLWKQVKLYQESGQKCNFQAFDKHKIKTFLVYFRVKRLSYLDCGHKRHALLNRRIPRAFHKNSKVVCLFSWKIPNVSGFLTKRHALLSRRNPRALHKKTNILQKF